MFRHSKYGNGFGATVGLGAAAIAAISILVPTPASSGSVSWIWQPAAAVPLAAPPDRSSKIGWCQTVKGLLGVSDGVGIGPSIRFTSPSPGLDSAGLGSAWAFGVGARVERIDYATLAETGRHAMTPWLDADALYVRSDGLDRMGFSTAVGVSMPFGSGRSFWLGPFVRYEQVVPIGFGDSQPRGARTLSVGFSLEGKLAL